MNMMNIIMNTNIVMITRLTIMITAIRPNTPMPQA
jgi:hypothetical protein